VCCVRPALFAWASTIEFVDLHVYMNEFLAVFLLMILSIREGNYTSWQIKLLLLWRQRVPFRIKAETGESSDYGFGVNVNMVVLFDHIIHHFIIESSICSWQPPRQSI